MKTTTKTRAKPTLGVYCIDDMGDQHWYVATSRRHAVKQFSSDIGYDTLAAFRKDHSTIVVSRLLDEQELLCSMENEKGDYDEVCQTALEWTKQGRGFVASTICD